LLLNWRDISNPLAGGAETHMHEFAKRWVSSGHSVTLLSSKFRGSPGKEVIDGVDVLRLGNEYSTYLEAMRFLARDRYKRTYDVVYEAINTVPYLSPLVAAVPVVAQIFSMDNKIALLREANLARLPIVMVAFSVSRLIPTVYHDAWVITNTDSSRLKLIQSGFRGEKVFGVPPGISEEFRTDIAKLSNPDRPNSNVVYLGRLKKYKDVQSVIASLVFLKQEIPNIKLLVIGKGDYEPQLKSQVSSTNLEGHVEFFGYVSEEQKASLLNTASLYVCTSADEGGWTISAIEAMAAGVPALVTPTQIDVIDHGKNGVLLDSPHPKAIASAISVALKDRARWTKMSENAKRFSASINWNDSSSIALEVLVKAVSSDSNPYRRH
jgi:glycosyltransferase involved in cell wall biosynthesis